MANLTLYYGCTQIDLDPQGKWSSPDQRVQVRKPDPEKPVEVSTDGGKTFLPVPTKDATVDVYIDETGLQQKPFVTYAYSGGRQPGATDGTKNPAYGICRIWRQDGVAPIQPHLEFKTPVALQTGTTTAVQFTLSPTDEQSVTYGQGTVAIVVNPEKNRYEITLSGFRKEPGGHAKFPDQLTATPATLYLPIPDGPAAAGLGEILKYLHFRTTENTYQLLVDGPEAFDLVKLPTVPVAAPPPGGLPVPPLPKGPLDDGGVLAGFLQKTLTPDERQNLLKELGAQDSKEKKFALLQKTFFALCQAKNPALARITTLPDLVREIGGTWTKITPEQVLARSERFDPLLMFITRHSSQAEQQQLAARMNLVATGSAEGDKAGKRNIMEKFFLQLCTRFWPDDHRVLVIAIDNLVNLCGLDRAATLAQIFQAAQEYGRETTEQQQSDAVKAAEATKAPPPIAPEPTPVPPRPETHKTVTEPAAQPTESPNPALPTQPAPSPVVANEPKVPVSPEVTPSRVEPPSLVVVAPEVVPPPESPGESSRVVTVAGLTKQLAGQTLIEASAGSAAVTSEYDAVINIRMEVAPAAANVPNETIFRPLALALTQAIAGKLLDSRFAGLHITVAGTTNEADKIKAYLQGQLGADFPGGKLTVEKAADAKAAGVAPTAANTLTSEQFLTIVRKRDIKREYMKDEELALEDCSFSLSPQGAMVARFRFKNKAVVLEHGDAVGTSLRWLLTSGELSGKNGNLFYRGPFIIILDAPGDPFSPVESSLASQKIAEALKGINLFAENKEFAVLAIDQEGHKAITPVLLPDRVAPPVVTPENLLAAEPQPPQAVRALTRIEQILDWEKLPNRTRQTLPGSNREVILLKVSLRKGRESLPRVIKALRNPSGVPIEGFKIVPRKNYSALITEVSSSFLTVKLPDGKTTRLAKGALLEAPDQYLVGWPITVTIDQSRTGNGIEFKEIVVANDELSPAIDEPDERALFGVVLWHAPGTPSAVARELLKAAQRTKGDSKSGYRILERPITMLPERLVKRDEAFIMLIPCGAPLDGEKLEPWADPWAGELRDYTPLNTAIHAHIRELENPKRK